jgi:ParB family chromosome partitioning protein
MAAKRKRGLSKGLDALLSSNEAYQRQPEEVSVEGDGEASEQQAQRPPRDGDLRHLPVELMQRGRYQPRKDMSADALEELAESIRAQGVMQPIVVRPLGDNRYEIIAGERRWRAAQMAELDAIPAVIREVPDEAAIAMSLIENIQRENLNPMEEALALSRLKEEFGLTHQQVADAVGKARTVVAKGLSVRQTETLVREFEKEKPAKPAPAKEDPNVRHLINDLSDRLGAPVQIQQGNAGKGKLVISYNNLDELDGILAHIK